MTSGNEYVSVEKIIHSNWADETEDATTDSVTKPKTKVAWGGVQPSIVDNAPDLATIQAQEEEAKKSEVAVKKQPAKTKPYIPNLSAGSYESDKRPYESSEPRGQPRERERHPIPVDPPFTAFVGNLDWQVTEEDVRTFFSPMGVDKIRLMVDEESKKQKGFGYVEFKTAAGLEEALKHHLGVFEIFKKRPINIDVAKPPQKAGGWGNKEGGWGNKEGGWGNKEGREVREKRDRERDTTWGPSNRDSKTASNFGSGRPYTSRPISSLSERPKLNINTPKPQQQQESPRPKIQTENPFGAAANVDYNKLDKIAQERDREMDRKKQEERKKKDIEHQEKPKRPLSAREPPTDSWRGGSGYNKGPASSTFSSNKRDEPSAKTERKPRPSGVASGGAGDGGPVVDSEGFRGQTTRSSRTNAPSSVTSTATVAARPPQSESTKQSVHKKEEPNSQQKIDKQQKFNRYEGLEEENI